MGRDKARLQIGGVPLAVRVARELRQVAYPVLAVGGVAGTKLAAVDDPREGPLAAFAAGIGALAGEPAIIVQPILLVACDMPFVERQHFAILADLLGEHDAIIPVAGGKDQPLCACYSPRAAEEVLRLVGEGKRAMTDLLDVLDVERYPADDWGQSLLDVDTPEEAESARRAIEGPE